MGVNAEGLLTFTKSVELLPYKPRPFLNIPAIYMIVNIKNDKYYIGSAVNVRRRVNDHKSQLSRNVHYNKYLQRAWLAYGENAFIFTILEKVDIGNLNIREQWWIDRLKSNSRSFGYNLRKLAITNKGYKLSEETKLRMSLSKKGKPRSIETKEKLRLANLGKIQSIETAEKRSLAMKGRTYTVEHKARMSVSMTGLKRSDEGKANMSLAAKRRWEAYRASKQ